MTPEQKAKELIEKFKPVSYVEWHGGGDEMTNEEAAKECAIIAVEEIINLNCVWFNRKVSLEEDESDTLEFWNEVLTELNK